MFLDFLWFLRVSGEQALIHKCFSSLCLCLAETSHTVNGFREERDNLHFMQGTEVVNCKDMEKGIDKNLWPSFKHPWWLSGKGSACNTGDPSSTPRSGKSPGEGNGSPLQYSCLGNPMDRGAWWATVTKSYTQLKWLNKNNNDCFSVFPRRQLLLILHGPNLGNLRLSYPDVSTLRPAGWLLHLSNTTGDNYV